MKEIQLQRVAPADIEARSMELITQELGDRVFPADQLPVVKRVIHTTASTPTTWCSPPARWKRGSPP